MRDPLRTGLGAVLVLLIMFTGSLVMWIGAPLLWLWVGGQIQAATTSVGAAVGSAFLGAVLTIILVAGLLSKLSNFYRANQRARGRDDPGHVVLEAVLVTSAGIALVAFLIWFFIFAGAEPLPFAGNNG
jgi:heme/copper-type cytochrome/quinol oxidase subunit 2